MRRPPNAAVLVVGPARFEATAVPELAMRDPKRPSLVVVRGARLLGAGGYAHWEVRTQVHLAHRGHGGNRPVFDPAGAIPS